jgi:hypothetical protein
VNQGIGVAPGPPRSDEPMQRLDRGFPAITDGVGESGVAMPGVGGDSGRPHRCGLGVVGGSSASPRCIALRVVHLTQALCQLGQRGKREEVPNSCAPRPTTAHQGDACHLRGTARVHGCGAWRGGPGPWGCAAAARLGVAHAGCRPGGPRPRPRAGAAPVWAAVFVKSVTTGMAGPMETLAAPPKQ